MENALTRMVLDAYRAGRPCQTLDEAVAQLARLYPGTSRNLLRHRVWIHYGALAEVGVGWRVSGRRGYPSRLELPSR